MVSFDDLKVSLSTYITRNKRVTYQDLLKWSSSNKVGNALLYLIIRELIHEKRFKVSGEYVIGTIRIGNNDIKLSIPMYIEVPGEVTKQSIPTRRQAKQRRTRSSSILEVFSEDKRPEEKRTTVEINENVVREVRTETSKEVKHEDAQQKAEPKVEERKEEVRSINEGERAERENKETAGSINIEGTGTPTDYSTVPMEDFMVMLRRVIEEELPQNREEGYKVAMAMLSYLQRYWSVGELRLKFDIAKQLGSTGENIMRIEDGVLRALRRLGIVEVVEPGVVNRVKELPKEFVKVRLDSLFT